MAAIAKALVGPDASPKKVIGQLGQLMTHVAGLDIEKVERTGNPSTGGWLYGPAKSQVEKALRERGLLGPNQQLTTEQWHGFVRTARALREQVGGDPQKAYQYLFGEQAGNTPQQPGPGGGQPGAGGNQPGGGQPAPGGTQPQQSWWQRTELGIPMIDNLLSGLGIQLPNWVKMILLTILGGGLLTRMF